jgi:hypothetical protein
MCSRLLLRDASPPFELPNSSFVIGSHPLDEIVNLAQGLQRLDDIIELPSVMLLYFGNLLDIVGVLFAKDSKVIDLATKAADLATKAADLVAKLLEPGLDVFEPGLDTT